MGPTTQARKAWNEAMRNAAGGGNLSMSGRDSSSTANSRTRSKRRERASKSNAAAALYGDSAMNNDEDGGEGSGGRGSNDVFEFRKAVRLDTLEAVEGNDDEDLVMEEEEEYDELEAYLEESGGGGKRKKSKSKPNTKKKKARKTEKGALPAIFKPRSLASILLEESSRNIRGGIVQKYLNAEARIDGDPSNGISNYSIRASNRRRRYCPVTGLEGIYTDPKSGIPYANNEALEQIKERPPPWMRSTFGAGTAPYYEACKSLRNED